MSEGLLREHEGNYSGLSPTDESAIAMGEARVTIGKARIEFSMATGNGIQGTHFYISDLRAMAEDEVRSQFKVGSEAYKSVEGFCGKEAAEGESFGYPVLLFKKDSFVMWMGGMGDMLGPTIMMGPGLWPRLKFWFGRWRLDFDTSGHFPRFIYGGKVRKSR